MKGLIQELKNITWVKNKVILSHTMLVVFSTIFLTLCIYGIDNLALTITQFVVNNI